MKTNILKLILLFIISQFSIQLYSKEKVVEILYVNSYHNGYYWSDGITEGIKKTFSTHTNYVLNIEYLDSKRSPDYYKDSLCLNYFYRKYLNKNIDLIITSDNDALDFVQLYKNHPIFKDKDVVACGISNIEDYEYIPDLFLIKEITTIEESIEIMVDFFPKMEELVFITDRLTSGEIYVDQIKNILKSNYSNIKLKVYDCIDMNTLADSIAKVSFPSVIFCSAVSIDCYHNAINEYEVAEILANNTNAPLFSGYYASIIKGYVGGSMTTGIQNGEITANVAVQILNKKKNYINKVTVPDAISIFDYKQLKKFKISKKKIPQGAVIIRSPESFWKKHVKILVISGLIILQLLIVIGFLYRSVNNQKKYEKQIIIAMENAKESERLKSIFLENVSHEMSTPLNSIVGFSDVLKDILVDGVQKKYLKIISENAVSLTRMVNHIVDFSVLKSNRYEIETSTFSLSSLINEITSDQELFKNFRSKPIKLTKDFDPYFTDLTITCDKEKLYLVIRNIINNAFKFTDKGEVAIKFRYSEREFDFLPSIKNRSDLNYVNFKIEDSGRGISNDDLEYIFEPFRQANESITDANRGIGLGLSISKSIIEILKGKVKIESIPNEGTSFFFSIPIHLNS